MAKHVESYELKSPITDRKIKEFAIEFKPGINIIVGENGSGKSTLLHLLSDSEFANNIDANHKIHLSDEVLKNGCDTKLFDTEKQNPRTTDIQCAPEGLYGFALCSHFQSHGQTMFPIVNEIKKFKDTVIFVDEPEAGISPKNQLKLWKAFKAAVKNNCQLIIATHSYIFIKLAEDVFDMESKVWMTADEYLPKL